MHMKFRTATAVLFIVAVAYILQVVPVYFSIRKGQEWHKGGNQQGICARSADTHVGSVDFKAVGVNLYNYFTKFNW